MHPQRCTEIAVNPITGQDSIGWRLDNFRSFDEYLERKFPESGPKAYYLIAIHGQKVGLNRAGRFSYPQISFGVAARQVRLALR